MPETVADVALALLGSAERHDLPSLTREELICLEVEPEHGRDRAWRDELSERELELLGVAGLRSLVAHHLVEVVDGVVSPRDELLVILTALTAPSWLLLLGGADDDPQILFRGLAGTDHCVIGVWSAGIHSHALTSNAAALREACAWLQQDRVPGPGRHVATVSPDRARSASAVVRRTSDGHVLVADHGRDVRIVSPAELAAWIVAGVGHAA